MGQFVAVRKTVVLEAGEDAAPRSGEIGVGPVAEVVLVFQFVAVQAGWNHSVTSSRSGNWEMVVLVSTGRQYSLAVEATRATATDGSDGAAEVLGTVVLFASWTGAECCAALKMLMGAALWVPMVGGEKTPPGVAAAGFR